MFDEEHKVGDLVLNGSPKHFIVTLGWISAKFNDYHWTVTWTDSNMNKQVFHEDIITRFKKYVEELDEQTTS